MGYLEQEKEKKASLRAASKERGRSKSPTRLPRCISPDISQSELRKRYEDQQHEAKLKEKEAERLKEEQNERVKRELRLQQEKLREQYKEQEKSKQKKIKRGPSPERGNTIGISNTNGSVPSCGDIEMGEALVKMDINKENKERDTMTDNREGIIVVESTIEKKKVEGRMMKDGDNLYEGTQGEAEFRKQTKLKEDFEHKEWQKKKQ